ncbi:MAG TPA: hypothetical protein VL651_08670 [Bacteroidia bacterium]|jgi:hypothetical protein|nr:hypothetical protein [Bacteroidia bacterium]
MKKFDNVILGFVIGMLAPILGLFGWYMFTYRYQTSFKGLLEYFSAIHIITASISLACYGANLPVFFLFIWREKYKSCRGVLFATIIYTLWVVYQKINY